MISTQPMVNALVGIAAVLAIALSFFGERWSDNLRFFLNPSVETAYTIGAKHFDGRNPGEYDIDRASYFLQKAESIDPGHPEVQLLLARIAFVRADFDTALRHINAQIAVYGDDPPSAYYVRALVYAFTDRFEEAARDYETFLARDPNNWAGLNDYAWVLMRGGHIEEALAATERGLAYTPENPWLLNSKAAMLFELQRLDEAYVTAARASASVDSVTRTFWLTAYPGNDPAIAHIGIGKLKQAIHDNFKKISEMRAATTTP